MYVCYTVCYNDITHIIAMRHYLDGKYNKCDVFRVGRRRHFAQFIYMCVAGRLKDKGVFLKVTKWRKMILIMCQ